VTDKRDKVRGDLYEENFIFFVTINIVLVAASATAQVNFSWDTGIARAGCRSPDRVLIRRKGRATTS